MLKYSNLNQQKTSRCPCILNFIILVFTFILLSIALLLCAFVSVKAQFLHLPKYKKLFASCPVCNAYLHTAALRNLGDFLQEDRFDKKTPASNTKLIKGHDFHVLISEGGYTESVYSGILSYATFGITGTGTHLPFVNMQAYRYGVMFF